jgi:redox-sensitive bicupin YhaK (pirin superfamily)
VPRLFGNCLSIVRTRDQALILYSQQTFIEKVMSAYETTVVEEPLATSVPASMRRIVHRTFGHRQGPITRLVSPSGTGEMVKPFVFLDRGEVRYTGQPLFGIHPHSGIATLTTVLAGGMAYEDTTGKRGTVTAGGVEWMKAGRGVWHDGGPLPGEPLRFFQLWVALDAEEELAAAESHYIASESVQQEGPVRVILGEFGAAKSVIPGRPRINYFHVQLKAGQQWRYDPPAKHAIAWLVLDKGVLSAPSPIREGELVVFEPSTDGIELKALSDASFVIGSSPKHPHPLVMGDYSVHTNARSLEQGELEILRIGRELRAVGRL